MEWARPGAPSILRTARWKRVRSRRGCPPSPYAAGCAARADRALGLIIALLGAAGLLRHPRPHPRLLRGFVNGHAVIRTISRSSASTSYRGVSNGLIWALVAMGYTLVYGIIELINFAHGDVFMIGSFVSVGLESLTSRAHGCHGGVRPGRGPAADPDHLDAGVRLVERPDRTRRIPSARGGRRVRSVDHGGRLLVHPAERWAAVARRVADGHHRPDQSEQDGLQDLRGDHPSGRRAGNRGDGSAGFRFDLVHRRTRAGRAMRATAQDPRRRG